MDWMNWLQTASPVYAMGSIVLGMLLLATLIVKVLRKSKPQSDFRELSSRIKSWWIMVAFFFSSLVVHPDASLVLFGFLSFMALKEYFTLIETRMEDHRALFWCYLAIPIQYVWVYMHWTAMFFIFIPVYMFLFVPVRLLLTGQPKGMVTSMAKIQWGLMAFIFCLSHVGFLMGLPANGAIPGGQSLVLYLVFLTEMNDISQYIWGKLFGRRQIAPTISPKKTWAGFVGGCLSTILLALCLQFLSGFTPLFSVGAGLLISVFGFFGDLVMSGVKRDVGVKDTGHLIPGHGGMLDRIDSLCYTAPLFFHFVSYFFYPALRP